MAEVTQGREGFVLRGEVRSQRVSQSSRVSQRVQSELGGGRAVELSCHRGRDSRRGQEERG